MKKNYFPYGIYARPGVPNKSRYIAECIAQSITSVRILPNQKLLSLSKLATQLGVDPKTIARSYDILQKAGWIEIKERAGCYVASHPPSVPMHHMPLFAEQGLNMPTTTADAELNTLKGYANFATIGAEGANPASLFLTKQSLVLKALDETTSISAKNWEEQVMDHETWIEACRYVLDLKRGIQVDQKQFAVGNGGAHNRTLAIKLLIKPGAGVLMSCFTEPSVIISFINARATPILIIPGIRGLKPKDIREQCKAYQGSPQQIELLYTNPQLEYNCDMPAALSAMSLLLETARAENLKILEEHEGDIPKEAALIPLSLMASPPVDNIVSINAYSMINPGLQDIRLTVGPISFIQAFNQSLLLQGSSLSIVDRKHATILAKNFALFNFALSYEQQLNGWRSQLVAEARMHLSESFDVELPIGGTSFSLKSKSGKEISINLADIQKIGIPVAHSRQETSNFCTATRIHIRFGWGNISKLKKCIRLLKTFMFTYWFEVTVCFG